MPSDWLMWYCANKQCIKRHMLPWVKHLTLNLDGSSKPASCNSVHVQTFAEKEVCAQWYNVAIPSGPSKRPLGKHFHKHPFHVAKSCASQDPPSDVCRRVPPLCHHTCPPCVWHFPKQSIPPFLASPVMMKTPVLLFCAAAHLEILRRLGHPHRHCLTQLCRSKWLSHNKTRFYFSTVKMWGVCLSID